MMVSRVIHPKSKAGSRPCSMALAWLVLLMLLSGSSCTRVTKVLPRRSRSVAAHGTGSAHHFRTVNGHTRRGLEATTTPRYFLMTSMLGFNKPAFFTMAAQLLRYCNPHGLDFSEAKLQQLGLDAALRHVVARSFLGQSPRNCTFTILVDADTITSLGAALQELAAVLPKQNSSAAHPPQPAAGSLGSGGVKLWQLHGAGSQKADSEGGPGLVERSLGVGVQLHDIRNLLEMPLVRIALRCMHLTPKGREATWVARFLYAYLKVQLPYVLNMDMDILILGNLDELFGFVEKFTQEQVLGLGWEMIPTYTEGRFNTFHAACPNCHQGRWDGFPAVNAGVALLHLDHMRASRRFKEIMGGRPDLMCKAKRDWSGEWPMQYGDQDLYNLLAVVYPDMLYIFPCEWNYQLCTGYRSGPGDTDNGCPYKPKLYHGNCGTPFPPGDLGVTYKWGPGIMTVHVTDPNTLKPSQVGGPPLNLTAMLNGRCACIKPLE